LLAHRVAPERGAHDVDDRDRRLADDFNVGTIAQQLDRALGHDGRTGHGVDDLAVG
jgi:hypothetical protein